MFLTAKVLHPDYIITTEMLFFASFLFTFREKNTNFAPMKRHSLLFLALLLSLQMTARHYDLTPQRISTADGLPTNTVVQIWQDDQGYIVLETRNGTCLYDGYSLMPASQNVKKPEEEALVTSDAFWERAGKGWLRRKDRDGTEKTWQLIPDDIIGYTHNPHFHVADMDERTEAITTYGSGLFLYDKPTGELTQLTKENSKGLISDNYLTGLFVDRTGCIWLIEDYLGVKVLRQNVLDYKLLPLHADAKIEDENNIRCISDMGNGRLLVSNQTGDVYYFDLTAELFNFAGHRAHRVYAALRDSHGREWIGTRGDGLYCNGKHIDGLPSPYIFNIREDSRGRILVSMLEGGITILGDDNSVNLLQGKKTHDALCLRDSLWVATETGLYLLDASSEVTDSLEGNFLCLTVSSKGQLWAGTADQGVALIRMNGQKIAATFYGVANGLANNGVNAVVEDKTGCLWMATEEGLSRLNPLTGDIANFLLSGSSLLVNVFNERAAVSLSDGRLLFGSRGGIVEIENGKPEIDNITFQTVITGVIVNGERLGTSTPSSLFSLQYKENNLTFCFSNFQYARQQSVRYQYCLDGIDDDWCTPVKEHTATYRHLQPGHYTFRVRSCINGQWSEATMMPFVIRQPWWNTWWAWGMYVVAVMIVAWLVFVNSRRMMRLRQQIAVQRQVNDFKTDFYNRIERELRSPVNVLQGAAENVQLRGTSKTTVQSLRRGSRRMLKLIEMIQQFHRLNDLELQQKAEQDAMNEDTEQRFRQIQQAIRADEPEFRELAPPPINEQTILVVDGDEDNLAYLADMLGSYFHIQTSTSLTGMETMVEKQKPDAVLIDTTAIEHDALELTRMLAETHKSLPVLHLSSFSDDAHQLRSLRSGAADYIVKPMGNKVLIERLTNAMKRRSETITDNEKENGDKPALLTNVSDKKFLNQFQTVLVQHVGDENFSIELFAEQMGLGRTQFYKKVKALTGETPVVHLQRERMNYACRLLRDTSLTVEDVMFRVGYHNATHFYNSFKKQTGMSPKEWRDSGR